MRPDLVIYHGPECYDGFTAAWLLHRQFPDAEFLPANYGRTEAPDVTGRRVVVVDFSWDRETMTRMAEEAAEIIVLDHHRTAEANLRGLDFAVFDMNRSGCQMAWDWLAENHELPAIAPPAIDDLPFPRHWFVDSVADRDLWKMRYLTTKSIHAYYTSVPMTFEDWEDMAQMAWQPVADTGSAIRRSIDRYCEKVAKEVEHYDAGGWMGLVDVVNAPYLNASELAAYLLENGETLWTAAWFRRADGRYQYSLRSEENFDVASIAVEYGGGGHMNAAGFHSALLPTEMWELLPCA